MIVAIDGPAGAGKSSVARRLARTLDFEFLDTGSLYRAATLAVLRQKLPIDQPDVWWPTVQAHSIRPDTDRVWLDDEEVAAWIRSPEVTAGIRHLADEPRVRNKLNDIQRAYVIGRDVVTEGRDQGTEVFPHAECKIFLTATPAERARRRAQQYAAEGQVVSIDEILAAQNKRDAEDASRPMGALRIADDAVEVVTDGMTTDEVIDRLVREVRSHHPVPGGR